MNDIVKQYYDESNDLWGYPQKYKNIEFYPLKITDSKYIKLFNQLFLYPKNYIPDKQIIKMSYLKFLLFIINPAQDADKTMDMILDFLKFVTKKEKISCLMKYIDGINDPLIALNLKIILDNNEFDENDFDNIREIILEQNGTWIEYIEDYNPDLEKSLNFINKNSKDIDFKDEIFIFSSLMGVPIDKLKDITLYQFKNQLEKLMEIKNYELIKPLEVSGEIKAKNGGEIVKHYFSHISKDGRYDPIFIDENKFFADNGLEKPKEN